MRLILAHRHDVAARELAARWGGEALLLTPADLHDERLLLTVNGRGEARAELPSRPSVTSVLSRLAGVGPADLDHVDPQDLGYAAAELDAFLRAWLGAWPGPVVNRPTTTCLNGPGWRPEQWILAAAAAGLPVRPVRRLVPSCGDLTPGPPGGGGPPGGPINGSPAGEGGPARAGPINGSPAGGGLADFGAGPGGDMVRVSVVGDRWFGAVLDEIGRTLCTLARASGCVLLEAMLDPAGTVLHAGAWPDVSTPDVAAALASILDRRPG